ncbi:collagen alpha-1(I) chain-like isoform X1 [Chrysemys picta bellii]|uniref:collagen alpha-1(I) chain-like isoform X1 n=1 Tax=Chrysemys picta bellii TaxID=8478 RepID=UPI0032B1FB7E
MDAGTDETSSTSCSPDVGGSAEGPLAAPIMASALTVLFLNLRYPKPSISLRPSGDVAPEGAVTVQCRGRHQNMRFLLYQDGNPNVLQDAEPAGDLAEFPIRDVSQRDAGSYSCYHHDKVYPFTWSHPSDPVELVVAGEGPGSVSPVPAPQPAGRSGARACVRGQADTGPPESMGHRTPPGSRVSSSGCGGHTKCPSKSGHIFIPVHAPDQGVSAPMGRSEPWTQQRRCPAGGQGRNHWWVPQQGAAAAAGGLRQKEGGSLPQGELQSRGLSQGDAPPAAPALGTHRGVRVQGLPSRPHPQPVTAFQGWLCDAHLGWGLSGSRAVGAARGGCSQLWGDPQGFPGSRSGASLTLVFGSEPHSCQHLILNLESLRVKNQLQ